VKVEFPARARCIEGSSFFRKGDEVRVLRMLGAHQVVIDNGAFGAIASAHRFKPIVRRIAGNVRT
jgi:hypothetical protein